MFVRNCKIDSSKPLKFSAEDKQARRGKRKPRRNSRDKPSQDRIEVEGEDVGDADYEKEYEDDHPKDFEYFFHVHCNQCNAEIGVYDLEEKVYHFFNTIPSLG